MPPGTVLPFVLELCQWVPPAGLRRYLLLAWVWGAASLGLAIVLGFAWPALSEHPGKAVMAAAAIVSGGMAWRIRRDAAFLELGRETTIGRLVIAVAVHTLAGYVVLIPLAGMMAVSLLAARGNSGHPEARWFVVVLSLWLPLLWAPAVGPWWAWRRTLRSRNPASHQ